jgi:Flp pilus assembly pilin Flp
MIRDIPVYYRNIKARSRGQAGQTLVEYALILAMISIALVGALGAYQGGLAGYMQDIVDALVAIFG